MFTPKGTAMRNAIVKKIYDIQSEHDAQEVWIPHITKSDLYKTSGHWDKFKDDLFHVKSRESDFVLKPMNCPHHTQIYASQPRSYKDLPLRYVESTTVYRDEQSVPTANKSPTYCGHWVNTPSLTVTFPSSAKSISHSSFFLSIALNNALSSVSPWRKIRSTVTPNDLLIYLTSCSTDISFVLHAISNLSVERFVVRQFNEVSLH